MTTPGTTATHGDRGQADVIEVDDRLGRTYPGARTELDHRDAFELLVATVLSAQTTDVRVNSLTPELFSRWPDAAALAGADEKQVTALLRPLGMGGTRAARIIGLAQGLLRGDEQFGSSSLHWVWFPRHSVRSWVMWCCSMAAPGARIRCCRSRSAFARRVFAA